MLLCIYPLSINGQTLHECQRLVNRLLPDFQQAYETSQPQLLQTDSYQRKLTDLRRALQAYESKNYGSSDSLARRNNDAVLLVLSGNTGQALQKVVNATSDTLVWHRGLARFLARDFTGASSDFEHASLSNDGSIALAIAYYLQQNNPTSNGTSAHYYFNKGLLTQQQGKGQEALGYFEQALALENHPAIRYQYGLQLAEQENFTLAIETLQPLADKHIAARTLLAELYTKMGNIKASERLLHLKKSGETASILLRANSFYQLNDQQMAKQLYSQALREKSLQALALQGLGNVALMERNYGNALRFFEESLRMDSTTSALQWGRAVALVGLKRYAEAFTLLQKQIHSLSETDRNHADLWVNMGFAAYHIKKWKDAEKAFEKALQLDSDRYEAAAGLSLVYIQQRKFPEAGTQLNKALQKENQNDRMHANYGNLLLHFGMFSKAGYHFNKAAALNVKNVPAKNGKAILLLEQDALEESKRLLDSLVRTNPNEGYLRNNRGIANAYLGNSNELKEDTVRSRTFYKWASVDFYDALDRSPEKLYYNVNLGNVYRYWKKYDEAMASYKTHLDKNALNNIAVLLKGNQRTDDALYYIDVAIQLDSSNRALQYNRKQILLPTPERLPLGSTADLTLKYSLDGLVTLYLYDYQYEDYQFPGRHWMPVPQAYQEKGKPLINFQMWLMPYQTEVKSPSKIKQPKTIRIKQNGKSKRSSTDCPDLF